MIVVAVVVIRQNLDPVLAIAWFYGVMVSTQDSESCDPSSNVGRT